MGLVNYDSGSDSDSDTPVPTHAPVIATTTMKKPFQKLINGGKIQVSLPTTTPSSSTLNDEPATKRPRINENPTNKFAGFNSLLPPPKNRAMMKTPSSSSLDSNIGKQTASVNARPRVGVNFKTGAAPSFSRNADGGGDDDEPIQKGPEILEGMKREEDVELKGNPLRFRPLSVIQKQKVNVLAKKKNAEIVLARNKEQQLKEEKERQKKEVGGSNDAPKSEDSNKAETTPAAETSQSPKENKTVSLFSFTPESSTTADSALSTTTNYTPMFESAQLIYPAALPTIAAATDPPSLTPSDSTSNPTTLANFADLNNLTTAERRELFGRGKDASSIAAVKLVNFNMDEEYRHNEELRARGDEQIHNPLRVIQPGKHNLRQMVNQVQNNREALEESFAAGKGKKKDASSRYGW